MPGVSTRSTVRYWLPLLLWLVVILLESWIGSSANTGSVLVPLLERLFPSISVQQIEAIHHELRKTGHLCGYGLLAYLIFRAARGFAHVRQGKVRIVEFWRKRWALIALGGTALVASADELHQMTLPSRTGLWSDVVLDTLGGMLFLLIVYLRSKNRRVNGVTGA